MVKGLVYFICAAFWCTAGILSSMAGGGPLNTLVVVNGNSRDSRLLGTYYAEKHGLSASHICTIHVDARASSISREAFENDIRMPIAAHLAQHQLEGQIDYLVLCMGIPTRVENFNGLTAALYYGYKEKAPDAPLCNIAPDSVNQYYASELAYSARAGWNQTNTPIPFLLTAADLATAKQVVDRAVLANQSPPVADALFGLYGSSDAARNVRHRRYEAAARIYSLYGKRDMLDVQQSTSPLPA
ncbi:MAG: TIGR03790 family protein, partial [Verrucomicrobiota bacterium]|nr:TIGR03790 family protein [Verrucomicrobiota bacterium]